MFSYIIEMKEFWANPLFSIVIMNITTLHVIMVFHALLT